MPYEGTKAEAADFATQSDLLGIDAAPESKSRTNLVQNPSAETNVTGWTVEGAGARSRITSDGYLGTCCFEINSVAATATGMFMTSNATATPSTLYTGSAYIKAKAPGDVGKVIRLDLLEYGAGGTPLISTTTATLALTANWQRIVVSKTLASNAAQARLAFRNSVAVAADYYADAVLLEQGTLDSYFDGSTGNGAAWTGTAHGSTSTITTVPVRTNDGFDGLSGLTAALSLLAQKSSPTFTGNPTAPTPTAGDNDTSIATTAFVAGEVATGIGIVGGQMPGCRVYNSAAQSVGNGADVALTFNSERWDDAQIHDTSTNTSRLDAPETGRYVISGHRTFATSNGGT